MSVRELREAVKILRTPTGGTGCSCITEVEDTWFDRSICPEPCGMMHTRCSECGGHLGRCAWDESNQEPSELNRALADWLEAEAALYGRLEEIKSKITPRGFKMSWGDSTQEQAEAVARIILGGKW